MADLTIGQIKALLPDGVVSGKERMAVVADLAHLADESPEVDPEAMNETIRRAARVIFADGLRLKEWEEVQDGRPAAD